jgi:hypothetical protein
MHFRSGLKLIIIIGLTAFLFGSLPDISGGGSACILQVAKAWAQEESVSDSTASSAAQIGSEEEVGDDIRTVALRRGSSLLRKGEFEFEVGVDYMTQEVEIPTIRDDRSRRLMLPVSVRAGLLERLDVFLALPLTYSDREIRESERTTSDHTVAIGDLTGGASVQLLRERYSWPEIIGTVHFLAPTGKDPYRDEGESADTGSGHWSISGGVQFVKTSDPVLLFWGASYIHQFEEKGLGVDIQPGDTIEYNFGLSFAANDDLSLSGQVIGAHQWDLELDGEKIDSTSRDPFFLSFSVTGRWLANTFLEPSVTLGINDDADDYIRVGLSLIRRWG